MQHILGLVRRCVEDYHMIDPGETVAVGVSGGKDSLLTLAALAQLRRFYPVPFNVHAITLETGTPGMSFDAVADLCRDLEVLYTRISVPVYQIVFEERKEKNPCSLCAKLRRGSLNTALKDLGISKIALGHHFNDVIETTVLGMFFGSDGVVKIPFDNYGLAQNICSFALIFIMFYGGFGTNWSQAKPVAGKAAILSSFGTAFTAGLVGLFCWAKSEAKRS